MVSTPQPFELRVASHLHTSHIQVQNEKRLFEDVMTPTHKPLHLATALLASLGAAAVTGFAQQPLANPNPPASPQSEQQAIRTVTEEVQLTVTALDNQGHLDPTLELPDILVLENGVSQELRSARRVPAHVLLLLDTGGEINSAKRVRLTREIARRLITALNPQDEFSVMQFNNNIEVLQDWTSDKYATLQTLDSKLISGKRARFLEALIAATARWADRPQGNRHLVMITDGVQGAGERVDRAAVFKRLEASNVMVHVISYTTVSRAATANSRRITRNRDKSIVPDVAIESLPPDHIWDPLRRSHEPGGVIADIDPERQRQVRAYEAAMRTSERQLTDLTVETGGRIWLPESFEEMIDDGSQAAKLIDSQYVVSYKPRRALAASQPGEVRVIVVASRRVGLSLVSRRLYVVPAREMVRESGRPRRVQN
jgi:VWFA-related protein